jgi:hypothetical protein
LSLALYCDLRICADDAEFSQPGVRLGNALSYPSTKRLVDLVGPGHAADLWRLWRTRGVARRHQAVLRGVGRRRVGLGIQPSSVRVAVTDIMATNRPRCPDCETPEGELHALFCTKERCPFCGGQLASCGCIHQVLALTEEERNSILKIAHGAMLRAGQAATQLKIVYNGAPAGAATLPVAPALPGIFFIENSDGSLNSPSHPARRGDYVAIYGTGGSSMSPAGITGAAWPLAPLSRLTQAVSVTVGAEEAQFLYGGSAPTLSSGFFQINAVLPSDLTTSVQLLYVTIGGVNSVAVAIFIQ